jgi:hypothetical protein
LQIEEDTDEGLTAQLIGLEGWRVEAEPMKAGRKRRFFVVRTKDSRPIHLELREHPRGPPCVAFKRLEFVYSPFA